MSPQAKPTTSADRPVNRQDPSTYLKPDEPLIGADGRDWSWAYVVFGDILGFPGYKAGTNGFVWSAFARRDRPASKDDASRWHPLVSSINRSGSKEGYCRVSLRRDKITYVRQVHTVILEVFIGPCPSGMVCCHGPRGKWDNRLSNLRWGTPLENAADKSRDGTTARGERQGLAKLDHATVSQMRSRRSGGETCLSIARDFPHVAYSVICRATNGDTYQDASGEIDHSKIRRWHQRRSVRREAN